MKKANQSPGELNSATGTHVVERNIYALLDRRSKEEQQRSRTDRFADSVTKFTGSMQFVCLHLVVFSLWIISNVGWLPVPRFDPSFVILAMFASVEAIFLSTFVMISQNRMTAQANKRADLDLQISLLTEHEVTRVLSLVTQIANRMNIETAQDSELEELKRDVHPEKVLDSIEQHEKQFFQAPSPTSAEEKTPQ
jgi:uncharacterized membrane protein